jgi:ribonuclease-3
MQAVIHNTVTDWLENNYFQGPQNNIQTEISSLSVLENTLGYKFNDKKLFLQALTHTSFTNEASETPSPSNERLEFLGDSIVNFLITKELVSLYPNFPEGELSKLRGALVNEKIFSELAGVINLSENIFIGRGEWRQKGHARASLLADTFEAILGAIFLDGGIVCAESVLQQIISIYNGQYKKDFYSAAALLDFDSKTQLQEICMSLFQEHPRYQSLEIENGFQVSVWLKDKCLIEQEGNSKKKLEKELAKIILSEKRYLI